VVTWQNNTNDQPKNIIMVVADGMGPAYVTAYRNFMDDPAIKGVEPVVFDRMLVGTASTYPAEQSGFITDSAASATALASGVKTYNGAIGVDEDKQPVKTVLHQVRLNGMKTGLAVTSEIVHATPASYVVANEYRRNYNQIADRFFDDRINDDFIVDVMLGGGQSYFERDDRNVTGEFIDAGFQFVDTYNELATLTPQTRVLGLFAPIGLPWVLDDTRRNRLSYLTQHAIKHLENPNGYFLLIEASQVDWAGHANDIGSAMAEMHDLALT
jgi:alkaline phosphatase